MGKKIRANKGQEKLIENNNIEEEAERKTMVQNYIALFEEEIEVIRDVLQEPNHNCKWGILILSVLLYRLGLVKQEYDDEEEDKVLADEYLEESKKHLRRLKQLDPDHYNRYEYLLRKH